MEWFGSYLGAWLGAGGDAPPGVMSATLRGSGRLDGTIEGVAGDIPANGHGFVITDTAPRLWWQRKPKAMPAEVAEQKVKHIAGVIERIASKQPAPTPEAKREIMQAIAPQLEQMPGFDWLPLYRTILLGLHIQRSQEEAQQQELIALQLAEAKRRDEEDVLILLMAA